MATFIGGGAHLLQQCLQPQCGSNNLTLGTNTNAQGQPTNSSVTCNNCGTLFEINIFK